MFPLDQHSGADRLFMAGNAARFIRVAESQHLSVQLIQIRCHGKRHPVITPEVTGFSLDPALFMTGSRRAELAGKAPM